MDSKLTYMNGEGPTTLRQAIGNLDKEESSMSFETLTAAIKAESDSDSGKTRIKDRLEMLFYIRNLVPLELGLRILERITTGCYRASHISMLNVQNQVRQQSAEALTPRNAAFLSRGQDYDTRQYRALRGKELFL